jgi:uncharacterized protein YhdP
LSVDNLTAHISREKQAGASHPDTRIAIDDKAWPRGALAMAWIPAQDVGGDNHQRSDELRIRASNLISRPDGCSRLPISWPQPANSGAPRSPRQNRSAGAGYPAGDGENALSGSGATGLEAVEAAAGAEHFSGSVAGSVENGSLHASMSEAKCLMPRSSAPAGDRQRRCHPQLGEE